MIFIRRRLLVWLLKAYLKRWGKTILSCFVIGFLLFFVAFKFGYKLLPKIPFTTREKIGIAGVYTVDSIPPEILDQLSSGLTVVSNDDTAKSNIAKSYDIRDDGKTYDFHLQNNVYFVDGKKLVASDITFPFSDVTVLAKSPTLLELKLRESYSPLPVTAASMPIFRNGLIGVGPYKIKNIDINGNFVQTITMEEAANKYNQKIYRFYDTQDALKLAFLLGDVTRAEGLSDVSVQNTSFDNFPNTKVIKTVDYTHLVTLFFNTKDTNFSDEKLRNGLTYSLPNDFSFGKRNVTPFSETSWVYSDAPEKRQDLEHAQLLLQSQNSKKIHIALTTLTKYEKTAGILKKAWEKVGIYTKIEVVDKIPTKFQIFLGDFKVPKDPDQYSLWHTGQINNITHYSSLRIDKLLEDGRKTSDITQRKRIYEEFQKYLLADSPAAFLYFPYQYELRRK